MVTMKAVLWCFFVAFLAVNADSKSQDKKTKAGNEKRSIEISPYSYLGGLGSGVQLLNVGTTGLISADTIPVGLIAPAISYDSGASLFAGSLGYSGSIGGIEGAVSTVAPIGSVTVPTVSVGESFDHFGGAFGSSSSLGSLGGSAVSSSDLGSASLTTGTGVVSTTASPISATTAANLGVTGSVSPTSVVTQDTHEYRHVSHSVPVAVPQPVPVTVTRTVPVPQPYTVHVPKPYPVPVQVRVPVEVPRPYAVRVPQPVNVPVPVRVPVEVPRPYPVFKTKEVRVNVDKPVFVRVPVKIQVPVPQAYKVDVPTPVAVRVPQPVFVKDRRIVNTYSNGGTVGNVHGGLYGLDNIYGTYGWGGTFGVNDFGGTVGGISDINTITGINGIQHVGGVFGDIGTPVLGAGGITGIDAGGIGVTESTLQGSTTASDAAVSVENDSITVEGRSGEGSSQGSVVNIGGSSSGSATESTESNAVEGVTEAVPTVAAPEEPTTISNVEITSPSLLK